MKKEIIRLIEDKTQRTKKIKHNQEGEERIFINKETGKKCITTFLDNTLIEDIENGLVANFDWSIRTEDGDIDDAGFFQVYKNEHGYTSELIPFSFNTLEKIEKHILEGELESTKNMQVCIFYYEK